MSRTEQNTAPFFPFFCKYGDAMNYLQTTYKNDGFATWVKILRKLSITNYHFLDLREKRSLMLLASECFITEELLLEIINILVEFKEFDEQLWVNYKVIWNQKFIESLNPLYERRKNKCLHKDDLVAHFRDKVDIFALKGDKLTQSKVKKSKEEESKVKILNSEALEGIFFKIGNDTFRTSPSKYFEGDTMKSFRDLFCMHRLSSNEQLREKQFKQCCEMFDKKYTFYSFTSENHIKNAFNKIGDNFKNGQTTKTTSNASGRGYSQTL